MIIQGSHEQHKMMNAFSCITAAPGSWCLYAINLYKVLHFNTNTNTLEDTSQFIHGICIVDYLLCFCHQNLALRYMNSSYYEQEFSDLVKFLIYKIKKQIMYCFLQK